MQGAGINEPFGKFRKLKHSAVDCTKIFSTLHLNLSTNAARAAHMERISRVSAGAPVRCSVRLMWWNDV